MVITLPQYFKGHNIKDEIAMIRTSPTEMNISSSRNMRDSIWPLKNKLYTNE